MMESALAHDEALVSNASNDSKDERITRAEILRMTNDIVSSHLAKGPVHASEIPSLIKSVFETLIELSVEPEAAKPEPEPERPVPAVPIEKSIGDDYIICLEDGKKLKMLKRHLMSAYGMTPDDYRKKWGLAPDYPMVAPAYARARSALARQIGLGRKAEDAPKAEAEGSKAKLIKKSEAAAKKATKASKPAAKAAQKPAAPKSAAAKNEDMVAEAEKAFKTEKAESEVQIVADPEAPAPEEAMS